jgi:hypothetical protein
VDSSQPTVNFGTSSLLRADGSPTVRAYLKFNVTGLSGTVSSVTLRVFANSAHSVGYDVFAVANTTWVESGAGGITFNTAPAPAATKTGSSGALTAGAWTSVVVTPLVSGNGVITVALTTTSATALSLASRESGANAPQLVVTTT